MDIYSGSRQKLLDRIVDTIQEQGADNVTIHGDDEVRYKGSTKPGKGSLFGSVDKGRITIIEDKDGYLRLTYEITMQTLFIATSSMSLLIGVVSQDLWGGLAIFGWVCGMNWIIILIRHYCVANDLAKAIYLT